MLCINNKKRYLALCVLCRQAVHGSRSVVPRSAESNPRPQPGQPDLQHDQQPQRQLPGMCDCNTAALSQFCLIPNQVLPCHHWFMQRCGSDGHFKHKLTCLSCFMAADQPIKLVDGVTCRHDCLQRPVLEHEARHLFQQPITQKQCHLSQQEQAIGTHAL